MKTLDKVSSFALVRASVTCIGLVIWTVCVYFLVPFSIMNSLPVFIFYCLLILNSFFSICVFATLTKREDTRQQFIDLLLAICLILLPTTFNTPLYFVMICLLLFNIATLKYIYLMPIAGYSTLFYRKIKVDTWGIFLCSLTIIGLIMGFSQLSLIFFTTVFFIANTYVLWHRPLYKIELHK